MRKHILPILLVLLMVLLVGCSHTNELPKDTEISSSSVGEFSELKQDENLTDEPSISTTESTASSTENEVVTEPTESQEKEDKKPTSSSVSKPTEKPEKTPETSETKPAQSQTEKNEPEKKPTETQPVKQPEEKIPETTKKNGWSQEDLADKMNVSRQAVSKWEGAQTIPDLEKILQLSILFGVTTDYLLKDEIEDEELTNDTSSDTTVKKISIEEANAYIEQRKKASWRIALATYLCILSPITLIVLSMLSELPNAIVTEATASAIGLTVLFAFILCAVPLYIYCGFKNQPYEFLDKNVPFELEYGVKGLVTETIS